MFFFICIFFISLYKYLVIMQRPYDQYFRVTDTEILGFFDEYRFLSNFHVADVYYQGDIYPSSEHAYQAAKFLDRDYRVQFMNPSMTCSQSRRLGQIQNLYYDTKWDEHKYDIMYEIVFNKFYRHKDLRYKLLLTSLKYLEETNHWGDSYWGVKFQTGEGENNLGKILMQVRDYWNK